MYITSNDNEMQTVLTWFEDHYVSKSERIRELMKEDFRNYHRNPDVIKKRIAEVMQVDI